MIPTLPATPVDAAPAHAAGRAPILRDEVQAAAAERREVLRAWALGGAMLGLLTLMSVLEVPARLGMIG